MDCRKYTGALALCTEQGPEMIRPLLQRRLAYAVTASVAAGCSAVSQSRPVNV